MILNQMVEQKGSGQKGLRTKRDPLWLGMSSHQPRPSANFSLIGLHRSYCGLRRLLQLNPRAQRGELAIAGLNMSPYQSVMAGARPRNRPAVEQTRIDHPTVEHSRMARR